MSTEMTEGEILARTCAAAAADKKADDIIVLDMRGISTFTDFFLICSGTSEPQIKAITSSIREQARVDLGRKTLTADGVPTSQWMILDFGEVIIHVFHGEMREFYGLETLWSDAPRLDLSVPVPKAA